VNTAIGQLAAAQRDLGLPVRWCGGPGQLPLWGDRQAARQLLRLPADVVHVHGLWQFPTRTALLLRGRRPVVITPHGMLDAWALAHARWKKAPVWHLWERRALRAAACLQALSEAEAASIRSLGLPGPVAVIPNAVTLPDPATPTAGCPWAARVPPGDQVLLFLGRFHPKKGLAPLLQAWRRLAADPARAGWWLALAGEGPLPLSPAPERVLPLGPVDNGAKQAVLAAASGFVLPSLSEGMPMAALEAMSWGLPCLLSPACHLPEAFAAGAALPVEPTVTDLERGLARFLRLSAGERRAMGAAGRALVAERFTWSRVAAQTRDLYAWLRDGGDVPGFVQF
jgi:poly(glycerol-phosphate) alpha-glucosyltransferase